MELKDTVELMSSDNYKDRFKAEYIQTKIRYNKLHNMLTSYDAGVLSFEPDSGVDILREQAKHMGQYLYSLEVRAKIEGIEIEGIEI